MVVVVVAYDSWQEFIDRCEMVIESDALRERLQLNAQQYIRDHHSTDHEKQQYINVIRKLTDSLN